MEKEDFFIDTIKSKQSFEKHLSDEKNLRIIFSAPFGSGKTTFIKEFFKEKEDIFQAFHLYPVNYSASSNSDIFELIKYDILFHFLETEIDFEKVNVPKSVSFNFFIKNNPENILLTFIRQIPTLGKQIGNLGDDLLKLYKKFELDHKENQIDQQGIIINYLQEIADSKGSSYEEDFYTQLICELSNQIKFENPEKKSVLILDDIDRIDPEHVFRILNVFSAHLDLNYATNKFNFDKIILVCDIENIRKIFSNRYGQNVDFSGYIDKFYSKEIYYFSIWKEIEEKINNIFYSIFLKTGDNLYNLKRVDQEIDVRFILYIIFALNNSGLFPIRKLLKLIGKQVTINRSSYSKKIKNKYIEPFDFKFLIVYTIIKNLFSDLNDIKEKLEHLKEDKDSNPYSNYKSSYLNIMIPYLSYTSHGWDINSENPRFGTIEIDEGKIDWELKQKDTSNRIDREFILEPSFKIFNQKNQIDSENINIFKLVVKAINVIEKYDLNWLEK